VRVVGKASNSNKFKFDADLLARFEFGGRFGEDSFPCVSPDQQKRFQAEFVEHFKKVQAQLDQFKWLASDRPLPPRVVTGPYQPRADFHVFVSEMYNLSKALVPSWLGQRGWMEFPAHRVVAGEASVGHELVHILFPSGNRMLAEGLAVYLQYKLFPEASVYPNFGAPLESLVESHLSENYPGPPGNQANALWSMDLSGLERIATPDELSLRIGKDLIGARPGVMDPPQEEVKTIYGAAGSFVGFLLENPIGQGYGLLNERNFGALYQSTPLRPLERDPGAPDRWQKFYRGKGLSYTFGDLALLWKTYMHFLLFDGGAAPVPIPDDYRRKQLVAKLYNKLRGMVGQSSTRPAAAQRPRKGNDPSNPASNTN
jgi:hypothetical protein